MVINDEIIAAYVDGRLSDSENREVVQYLATHPEERFAVLALMDKWDETPQQEPITDNDGVSIEDTPYRKMLTKSLKAMLSTTSIAAAAFVPLGLEENENEKNKIAQNITEKIKQSDKRLLDLWDEIHKSPQR
ncbi:MAG TPA: hypothetical protein IAA88_06780 [Candidatus Avimuribaculum pullicola]|nr:hypothetical protein [Candidatus Avimuribaculum pullicola]